MTTGTTLTSARGPTLSSNETTPSRQGHFVGRQSRSSTVIAGPCDGPSMFDSASNVGIYGGRFTAQHAPQASVTVNINHGRVRDQSSDEYRDAQTHNSSGASNARNRPRSSRSNQPLELQLRPVQRSNMLYEQHLLHKGRGHPLWIPQPNLRLPIPYRAKGVSIGDVGIITPDGAFDFLFNICLPTEDPIHSEELPEEFAPLNPPLSRTDVREFREFTDGSYLASASVAKVRSNHQETRGLAFESSASEGAILTMPEGAYMEELNNISKFRDYISVHAENWYKFVNGPRGREAKNGDLRLVVGCDKTSSWGMAIFSNFFQQTNFRLEFNARRDENGQVVGGYTYNWDHAGTAEVRTGPGTGENDELISDTVSYPLRNQCLFVRTLSVALSDTVWKKLHPKPPVEVSLNLKESSPTIPTKSPRISPRAKPKTLKSTPSGAARGAKRILHPTDALFKKEKSDADVIITSLPSSLTTVHPAKVLNDFLLKEIPEARMAVTNDRDWYISSASMSVLSSTPDLISHIRETNNVGFKNGVVYFEPKELDDHQQLELLSSQVYRLIHGTISVEQYLFGQDEGINISESRNLLLDHLQSELLQDFLVDGVDLREYIGGQVRVRLFPAVIDALEDLRNKTSAGSVKVSLQHSRDGGTNQFAPLTGHPHRLLSLDEVIHLAGLRLSALDYNTNQISPPDSETIATLRSRLDSYPTRFFMKTRIICMQRLSGALLRRFSQCHQREDLDEAIFYYKEASTLTSSASILHLEASLGLCASLYQRVQLLGRFEDLVELIRGLKAQSSLDIPTLLKPIINQLRDPPKRDHLFFNQDPKSSTTLPLESTPTTNTNPNSKEEGIPSKGEDGIPRKEETKNIRARIRKLTDATFRSTSGFWKKKISRGRRSQSLSRTPESPLPRLSLDSMRKKRFSGAPAARCCEIVVDRKEAVEYGWHSE